MSTVNAIYERHGNDWVASVVELPGAISQGASLKEAKANLQGAIYSLLRTRFENGVVDAAEADEIVYEQVEVDLNTILGAESPFK